MIFLVLLIGLLLLGILTSITLKFSSSQKQFLKGKTPPKLEGFFQGFAVIVGPWRGKFFDSTKSSGINVLEQNNKRREVFPFKTYVAKGVQDKNLNVLKIDYNIPENPFWVRPILDELVEVSPGKYLGKAYLRLFPNFPLILIFFKLEQ